MKGKITQNGMSIEVEGSHDEMISFVASLSKSASVTSAVKRGRPKGSKTKSSNSIKFDSPAFARKEGAYWTSKDLSIIARVVAENNAIGRNHGVAKQAHSEIIRKGDNKRRSLGGVQMAVFEIRRHLKGRSDSVSERMASMLNELGYTAQPKAEAQTQGTVAKRESILEA